LRNKGISFLLLVLCLELLLIATVCAETKPIEKGAPFPHIIFKDTASKEVQKNLGLLRKSNFSFREIPGDIIIVELFNTYCVSCPKNVPILNKLYSTIENDTKLKGKVRLITIAVGNNQNEVKEYTNLHKVLYPVITDLNFSIHRSLGSPRVPYAIFVKRNAKGKNIVVDTHSGIFDSYDEITKMLRIILK
jgi:hypothetical protein